METYKKQKIPKALREQLWIHKVGRRFETKCKTPWCKNKISVFDFQCGHDIPESRGGKTDITNLVPICGRCNLSMGNQYTFSEWCKIHKTTPKWKHLLQKFVTTWISSDTTENGSKLTPNPMSPKGKQSRSPGNKSKTLPLTLNVPIAPTLPNSGKR